MATSPVNQRPFFPASDRHPYYIVTPPYARRSAGLSTLHFLCHALNSTGQSAFVFLDRPNRFEKSAVNPEFLTQVLTQDIIDYHFEQRRCPIVVYPEIIYGNPLAAPLVVRYVLNFPGLLGGDPHYAPSELCFGYSGTLARAAGAGEENILFVPISDTRVFYPRPEVPRTLACFYAKKYKMLETHPEFHHPAEAIEITDEMSRSEIADLFTHSKLLYCYENTALSLEAALCNCPTLYIKNKYFTAPIAGAEFGRDGVAFSDDAAEIEQARLSVSKVYPKYLAAQDAFWGQLDHFVALTQERARSTLYLTPISAANASAKMAKGRVAEEKRKKKLSRRGAALFQHLFPIRKS